MKNCLMGFLIVACALLVFVDIGSAHKLEKRLARESRLFASELDPKKNDTPANQHCTPVDTKVEGIPPGVTCLEHFMSDKGNSSCKPSNMKREVRREIFGAGDCKKAIGERPKVNANYPVCLETGGNAPKWKDQPEIGANSNPKNKTYGRLNPTQALRNAFPAIVSKVQYSQCERWQQFRIDCVGLIARAWNLHGMAAFTTDDLKGLSEKRDKCDLIPGDILNSKPHVMMFHHWVVPGETFVAWQAAAPNLGHIETKEDKPIKLSELIHKKTDPYECRRYKFMKDEPVNLAGLPPVKK